MDSWSQMQATSPPVHCKLGTQCSGFPSGDTSSDNLAPLDHEPNSFPQISLNALAGMLAPENFCIYGSIHHHSVVILVDGGSTYNFIQSRMAKFLNLLSLPTTALQVMVDNDSILDCNTTSP